MLTASKTQHWAVSFLSKQNGERVMTYEELREEAKRQGYRLVALDSREKLLPCTCGNKRRTHFDTWEGGKWIYMLTCTKCGKTAKGHSVSEVNRNWNEMIKMEMSK